MFMTGLREIHRDKLITAAELKLLVEKWALKLAQSGSQDPFPLGYLVQPGRFNVALVAGI